MDSIAPRLTRKSDLRTGTSVWLATPNITPSGVKTGFVSGAWDVAIVGAGISGALMAERLTRAGRKVLVLDRRDPVRGSTPASTALIQHEIDVPLTELSERIGTRPAAAAWLRSVRAVQDLEDLVRRLSIDCGWHTRMSLFLAGDAMGSRGLKAEAAAREAAGVVARYLSGRELRTQFGIDRTAAIVAPASAVANPAQLAARLLDAATARGAAIASPVEITDVAELPCGVALATGDGRVAVAGHAVFCTGYEFLPRMESRSHGIVSSWAIASRPRLPRPPWLDDFVVWEASDPYLYLRSTPDGRVIAGGEDEDSATRNSDPRLLRGKSATIAAKLATLTGIRIGRPAYSWSGQFGTTTDGLPIIDRVPGHERIFSVMGFGGNGITFSAIAAEIVARAIEGKPDPDAAVFAFR